MAAGVSHVFIDRTALLLARDAWCADPLMARDTYGEISEWNVEAVTDMSWLFCGWGDVSADCNDDCRTFNGDVSSWDVSSVTDMSSAPPFQSLYRLMPLPVPYFRCHCLCPPSVALPSESGACRIAHVQICSLTLCPLTRT